MFFKQIKLIQSPSKNTYFSLALVLFRLILAFAVNETEMLCRPSCGACCIAPSISSIIPGMPNGKAAGEKCIHLLDDMRCDIFGHKSRPKVCADFQADNEICKDSREMALITITELETLTR